MACYAGNPRAEASSGPGKSLSAYRNKSPARVEIRTTETPPLQFAKNDSGDQESGDQESGDDEEHIDPREPSGQPRRIGVKDEYPENRHRAQAVDVRAVLGESVAWWFNG